MRDKTITLREAREARGLTIAQLSEKSGIGWSLVQAIEQGRTPGNIVTRHKLSDALGVPFRVMWPDSLKEMGELFDMMRKQRQEGDSFKDGPAMMKLFHAQMKKEKKRQAEEMKLDRKAARRTSGKVQEDASASRTK